MLWCLALLLPGCIEPYMPDAISSKTNYLVVDGFINPRGSTTIVLSRTFDIASKAAPPAETRATVYIEEEGGARYTVPETVVKGTYTSAALVLTAGRNYRLHILTSAGKDYASAYGPAKTTPPIDNVNWRTTADGLTIYVNTHDDANATQYYRWEYEETWEIIPPYSPRYEYRNNRIQDLLTPFPSICWGNNKSTDIKISNTRRLMQDVVADYPIRSFSTSNDRLAYRYSILVKQYAQTAEEYAYWDQLKKNTENIGTLFDPLPTQLTGNIRCLNDETELALGYIGTHSLVQRRIFIARSELPRTWPISNGYESCVPPDTLFLYKPSPGPSPEDKLLSTFGSGDILPIDRLYGSSGIIGYTAKSRDCIDCRTRGAAVKPSFWP